MKQEKKKWSQAMTFIVLFGIVSLFSDMTHEGASSIRGAYLSLLGASAGMIGFVSGLGELVGYSMRYVFGKLTDKTKRYWPMTIFGYLLDVLAVPALALVGEHGWIWACALLIIQRMGKAIKKPAKDTIMYFADRCVRRPGAALPRDALSDRRHDLCGLFPLLCRACHSGGDHNPAAALHAHEVPEPRTL